VTRSARLATLGPLLLLAFLASAARSDNATVTMDVRTISSCEDPAAFSAARSPDEPSFDFRTWDLAPFASASVEGRSLRWRVQSAGDAQRSARLAWSRSLSRPMDAISLWLKNPNGHELMLRVELIDADGARYLSAPVDLAAELNWRQVRVSLSDLAPESGRADPFPGIDLPVIRLALVVQPLAPGVRYDLYIDEIAAHAAPMRDVEVEDLDAPTTLGPGEPVPVRARLRTGDPPRGVVAQLTSEAGGLIAQAPMTTSTEGEGTQLAARGLRAPEWLPPGRYRLRVHSDHALLVGPGARPLPVAVGGAAPPPAEASIDTDLSPPAIVHSGERWAPQVLELRGRCPAQDRAAIVGVAATTDFHPFGYAPDALADDGSMDFSGLDRRVAAALGSHPQAGVLLQVHVGSSPGWDAAHADQLQQFDGAAVAPPQIFGRKRTFPDLISPGWQREALDRLRALVEHAEAAPWGTRVIGYELQAGDLGAWRPWGASLGLGDEYTPLRLAAYRDWVRTSYGSVADFRDAWMGRRRGLDRPFEGFDAVRLPRPLPADEEPSLYDPGTDQPMIDLQQFRASAPADLLLEMAGAVREASGGAKLVGACYGHMLAQSRHGDWRWPHLALSRVLESGALDFLTGTQWLPGPPPVPAFPAESARLAGVLYLERITPAHAQQHFASAAVTGAGIIGEAEVLARAPQLPRPDFPDAAAEAHIPLGVVVDDASARYLSEPGGLAGPLLAGQLAACSASGIPWRLYLLRDAVAGHPHPAAAWLMADVLTIRAEDGRRLARATCRDGALLIWVYAPGAVAERLITGRTMEYLTGIKLVPLHSRGRVSVTPAMAEAGPYGFAQAVSPRFISADEHAEWLGSIAGTEYCGLSLRSFPRCTSVFSAAPPSAEVLRQLCHRADVEPWTSGGPAIFGPRALALLGSEGRSRTIRFPRPVSVTNLRTGEVVVNGEQTVTLAVEPGEIALFGYSYE